jgi:hypothetical protein
VFFVEEHDSVTGCLMPQQFFSRWIYPCLLLHIAVNPALCEIFELVRDDHGGGGFCLPFHSGSDYVQGGNEKFG